ncbi:MAG: hypothetical protein LRS49_03310, partial [Desulfurococcales archaeon]|nr:hypothetical protein [Desulfurococcales archaeon]
ISPVHLAAESAGGVAVPPTRIPAGSTPLDVVSSSTFEVGGGHVVLLPFVRAPIERRRSATRILLEAASRLAARLGGPRVLAAHLGLEGYTFPDDAVASPQSLAGFDYAALGHIHKRIISTGDSSPAPWAYPAPLVPLNAQEARLSVEEPWPRGPLVVEVSRGEARVEEVEIEQPRLQAYLAASRPTRDSLLRAAREALARAGARARVRGGSKPLLHLSLTLGGGPSELSPREAVRLLERSLGVRVRVSSVKRFRQPAIVAASPAGGVGGEVEVIARLLAGGRRGVAAPEALARLAEGILALKREAARDDADPQAVQSMLEELVSSGEYEPAWRAVEGAARSWWG